MNANGKRQWTPVPQALVNFEEKLTCVDVLCLPPDRESPGFLNLTLCLIFFQLCDLSRIILLLSALRKNWRHDLLSACNSTWYILNTQGMRHFKK